MEYSKVKWGKRIEELFGGMGDKEEKGGGEKRGGGWRKKKTWGECGRSVEDSSTGRNERRKSEDQTIYRKAS